MHENYSCDLWGPKINFQYTSIKFNKILFKYCFKHNILLHGALSKLTKSIKSILQYWSNAWSISLKSLSVLVINVNWINLENTCHGSVCSAPSSLTTHARTWYHLSLDWAHLHFIRDSSPSTIKAHTSLHSNVRSRFNEVGSLSYPSGLPTTPLLVYLPPVSSPASCLPLSSTSLLQRSPAWKTSLPVRCVLLPASTSSWQGKYIIRHQFISAVVSIQSLHLPFLTLLFNKPPLVCTYSLCEFCFCDNTTC